MGAMATEDDTHERRYIRNVPAKLWWRLRLLSLERDTPISKLVIEAIEDYLDRDGEPDEQDRLLAFHR